MPQQAASPTVTQPPVTQPPSPQPDDPRRRDSAPREGHIETDTKPTLAEIAAMLKLDPAHETLHLVSNDRGETVKRSFDGIPVLADVKVSQHLSKWHTRFRVVVTPPKPARRRALVSKAAAVRASGLKGVAELVYRPVFVQHQIPGSPGDNAYDYDMRIQRFDLVYRVSAEHSGTGAEVDAYTRRRSPGRSHANSSTTTRRSTRAIAW